MTDVYDIQHNEQKLASKMEDFRIWISYTDSGFLAATFAAILQTIRIGSWLCSKSYKRVLQRQTETSTKSFVFQICQARKPGEKRNK